MNTNEHKYLEKKKVRR